MKATCRRFCCCLLLYAATPLFLVAGCAHYTPLPLRTDVAPMATVELLDFRHDALPECLSLDDIVLLALRNNPGLIAARAQRGIGQAQVLEAGIAPNPSLNAAYGFLLGGPGTMASFAGGLGMDIKSVLTMSYRKTVAAQTSREIDANLLWQEWQVIAKVRQVATALIESEKRRRIFEQNAVRLSDLVTRSGNALTRGDITLTALVTDLAAEAGADQMLAEANRQQAASRRELNILLGLAPAVPLVLTESMEIPAIDSDRIREALDTLPQRRPDLLALQLGYRAQEARVRMAVLAQFPLFSLGVAGGHDNSDIRYVGPQASIELPLFNRNQGVISTEWATRRQLHDEFTARLIAARSEVIDLLADQQTLDNQLALKRLEQRVLDEAAGRAISAHDAGDLDERTYLDAVLAREGKALEILAIEQNLLLQQIAIGTLIGAGMPAVSLAAMADAS